MDLASGDKKKIFLKNNNIVDKKVTLSIQMQTEVIT